MSARAEGKEQRRMRIVDAARMLMQQPGGSGFSMRSLARTARVSIATPYNLFGSKQAILLAVLDADLNDFEARLGSLDADRIEVLFEASALMSQLLEREPDFYRNALCAVIRDGPKFRFMVNGPRYRLWKELLRRATEAGLLDDGVDPDAFAIASSQLVVANVLEWAQGDLTLGEMAARNEYGLALTLRAVATDQSRSQLKARMRKAEGALRKHRRARLKQQSGARDAKRKRAAGDPLQTQDNTRGAAK